MWDGWTDCTNTDDVKSYELMVGTRIKVLLTVTLAKIKAEPLTWQVEIISFAPSAGEYILYKDVFSTLEDAETKAWEEAQIAVRKRDHL